MKKEEGQRMRESCTLGFFNLYFLHSPDVAASGGSVEVIVKNIGF